MTVWFTPEEDAFILEHIEDYTYAGMARQLSATFGIERGHYTVSRHCKEVLGIELTSKARFMFGKDHVDYLRECAESGMNQRQMSIAFNNRFSQNTCQKTIQKACARYNLFPERKGLAMIAGERNPFTLRNPIGYERRSGGKVYVKVADEVYTTGTPTFNESGNWQEKKRYMYEKYNGSIPDGYYIIHLNGDKKNFEKDNLYAITPQVNMLMGANRWYSIDPEVTLTAIKWCELFYATKEIK